MGCQPLQASTRTRFTIRRNRVSLGEVGHNRRPWVARIDIQDVALRHAGAKTPGVAIIPDFEHATADIPPVRPNKVLDVIAIDRPATIIAPEPAQWGRAAKGAKKRGAIEAAEAVSQQPTLVGPDDRLQG